jgi:membrane protein DedA with SNARE-associated domain
MSSELLTALGWYASIFLWLYLTGIGLPPFPEEGGIGYAAWAAAVQPDVHWWGAWPAAGAGILCADMTLYAVGRLTGPRLFEYRWARRLIKPERRQRFENLFHTHGTKILLTARLLPPLRTGVFIMAGALSFSFLRFLLADALYAVVGVGVVFFFGAGLMGLIHTYAHEWWVWAIAAAFGVYLLVHYYRRLRQREVRISTPQVMVSVPAPASIIEAVQDSVPRPQPGEPPPEPVPAPEPISTLLK